MNQNGSSGITYGPWMEVQDATGRLLYRRRIFENGVQQAGYGWEDSWIKPPEYVSYVGAGLGLPAPKIVDIVNPSGLTLGSMLREDAQKAKQEVTKNTTPEATASPIVGQSLGLPWVSDKDDPLKIGNSSSTNPEGEAFLGLVDYGSLDFAKNQWTGYLFPHDFTNKGNIIALGPASEEYSQIEALALVGLFASLSKTKEGVREIGKIATTYLDTMGTIIDGLHMAGTANPFNNIINEYIAVGIYRRLGLMSPRDATQCRAWIDHNFGEMLKKDYFKDTITGLTSLVAGSKVPSNVAGAGSFAGLGALANLLGLKGTE